MVDNLIKIPGRSGCKVEPVLLEDGELRIRKISPSLQYNTRLLIQATKQGKFLPMPSFFTPKILIPPSNSEKSLEVFEMEYVAGLKFSEYFLLASKSELDRLCSSFITYFEWSLSCCETYANPAPALISKYTELLPKVSQLIPSGTLKRLTTLFESLPDLPIPLTPCHGDFTLSNMLFLDGKVCILDFLDSYIESPLIDIVKLRQDTSYGWSCTVDCSIGFSDKVRINQVLEYLDTHLISWAGQFEWYRVWYLPFQVVNLLRILPYLTDSNEISFVVRSLEELLNSYEPYNTCCR